MKVKSYKNLVTQVYAADDVAKAHLNFFENTRELYNDFQRSVYVEKVLLSDKLTKFNFLPLDHVESKATSSGKEVKKVKSCQEWQIRHCR